MVKKYIISAMTFAACATTFGQTTYPATKKIDHVDDYQGTKVADPYRWLEDDNSAETKNWVEAQNKVTFDYLNKIPYRGQMKKRIEEVINYPRYSSPTAMEVISTSIRMMACKTRRYCIARRAWRVLPNWLWTPISYQQKAPHS